MKDSQHTRRASLNPILHQIGKTFDPDKPNVIKDDPIRQGLRADLLKCNSNGSSKSIGQVRRDFLVPIDRLREIVWYLRMEP